MAGNKYWYPTDIDEKAAWHANWNNQLPNFAAKYNIIPTTLATVAADNTWMQYWVMARHTADALSEQLTKYFNTLATGSENAEAPEPVNFALPDDPPSQVKPGIKARVQEIATHIKGHMNYSEADGELLGIVSDESKEQAVELLTAEFSLRRLPDFELEASFNRHGMDSMRCEVRHKGGNWQMATILTSSPGTFAVEPTTPDTAEQIEVRAILLKKNQPIGNYSDIKTALIAP
jgi:hypothetical protein